MSQGSPKDLQEKLLDHLFRGLGSKAHGFQVRTIVHKMPVCAQRDNIETSTKKDDLASLAFSERTTTVRAEEIQKRNAQASVT